MDQQRKLRVLNVAYPLAPVGPDVTGGAEQVLTAIDGALTAAGHHSIVIACEDSTTTGTLVTLPRQNGPLTHEAQARAGAAVRAAIDRALSLWPIDLIHLHGIDFHTYLPPGTTPVLATLHLPVDWYPRQIFSIRRPHLYLQCVSAHQHRACPVPEHQDGSHSPHLIPAIDNGVDHSVFQPCHRKRSFALALGRICPEKGFHLALDAAKEAGMPLLVGGRVFRYEAHEKYFAEEVLPRLDSVRRFLGPIGLFRKRRLLSAARCLVITSLVPETSSLVAMEALACGTPVVAFPAGALTEIIEHGRTGFLVRDTRELAAALSKVDQLSQVSCRQAAVERFGAARMVEKYFEVYHRLANIGLTNKVEPAVTWEPRLPPPRACA